MFSVACAAAPTAPAMIGLRFLQGLFGGVAVVIARAIVRDRATGAEAARIFSLLILVGGTAPVVAPLFGGAAHRVHVVRGILLALLGALGLVATLMVLPETLAPADRRVGASVTPCRLVRRVVRNRTFLG